jgi:hypothetical protein
MSRPRRPTRPATPKATAQIENKKRKSVIHECGVDGWQPPTKRSSCLPCGRGRQPRQSRGVERTPRRHARMCCAALSTSSVTLTLLFYSLRNVARERRLFVDAATFPAPADSFIHRAGPNRLAQPQQQYSQPRPLPPPCFHPPPPPAADGLLPAREPVPRLRGLGYPIVFAIVAASYCAVVVYAWARRSEPTRPSSLRFTYW